MLKHDRNVATECAKERRQQHQAVVSENVENIGLCQPQTVQPCTDLGGLPGNFVVAGAYVVAAIYLES